MLIRKEQMDALESAGQERYLHRLRSYLRLHVPGLVAHIDDAVLLERIRAAVPQARAAGIRSDEGVLAFVALAIAAGPGFFQHPSIRKFFAGQADDPERKIRWLYQRVTAKLADRVNALRRA
jgi:hypothetical protein